MLRDGGVDVAVSEKIKAWAVADALSRRGSKAAPCCAHCGKGPSELGAGEKLRKCGGCGVARSLLLRCLSKVSMVCWTQGRVQPVVIKKRPR